MPEEAVNEFITIGNLEKQKHLLGKPSLKQSLRSLLRSLLMRSNLPLLTNNAIIANFTSRHSPVKQSSSFQQRKITSSANASKPPSWWQSIAIMLSLRVTV